MADYTFSADYYNNNVQANRGPFYDSTSGDYYVIIQSQDSTWDIECWRSTDDGDTYSEQDASNAPTPGGTSQNQYGNGATGVYVSGTRRIYVFYWVMTSSTQSTLRATYFNCSTNAWHTSTWDGATGCYAPGNTYNHGIDAEYKSSTEIGVYYMGPQESVKGTSYERMNFQTFNPNTNAWGGSAVEIPTNVSYDAYGGGMTYDDSGDVICTCHYYESSGSQMHIFKIASGSYTDHGQSGNVNPFSNQYAHPSSVYSGLSTEEFAIPYGSPQTTDALLYDNSTSPTTTPWTSTSVDSDDDWVDAAGEGASVCYVGTKRYLFAYKQGTTNLEVHCWTKDGTGSWTEVGMIWEHSADRTPQTLRVNHLKTDTNEFFGFVLDPLLGYDETTAVIWEEGGAITRTKTASVDAKLVPPGGVLPNIQMPEVVLTDIFHANKGLGSTEGAYVIAVAKDNNKELVMLKSTNGGKDGNWTEHDSMHTFANEIKSLHVNNEGGKDGGQFAAVTVQLSNGDVYWGLYSYAHDPADSNWRTDAHQWLNGPALTPRLVASPGTPDEFGAASCGDYYDSNNMDLKCFVFFHQKVSTKNKIMWCASLHDEYHGEYNSVGGGYYTEPQRLDPDSTDDEYLGIATKGNEVDTDDSGTRSNYVTWQAHVLYTREGASTTKLIYRRVWPSTLFEMYTDATGGTFDLTWNDHTDGVNNIQTITNINYNSSAATIKSKLESATGVTTVNVTGTGTKSDPWIVNFTSYSGTIQPSTPYTHAPNHCVAHFEPDSTNLTSGTAYVAVPTSETDMGTVKHQSRIRGQLSQSNPEGGWYGANYRDYWTHIGTDSKPILIETLDYNDDYDWADNWAPTIVRTGIGTKTIKQDSNGYPMVGLLHVIDKGYKNSDLTEHWAIMLVDASTDDVHILHRVVRDTDYTPVYDPL